MTRPSKAIVDDPPPSSPIAATAPRSIMILGQRPCRQAVARAAPPVGDDEEQTAVRLLADRGTRVARCGRTQVENPWPACRTTLPFRTSSGPPPMPFERPVGKLGHAQAHSQRRSDRCLGQERRALGPPRLEDGAAGRDRRAAASLDGHDRAGQVGAEPGLGKSASTTSTALRACGVASPQNFVKSPTSGRLSTGWLSLSIGCVLPVPRQVPTKRNTSISRRPSRPRATAVREPVRARREHAAPQEEAGEVARREAEEVAVHADRSRTPERRACMRGHGLPTSRCHWREQGVGGRGRSAEACGRRGGRPAALR